MSALISDPTGEVLVRKIIEVWLDADIGAAHRKDYSLLVIQGNGATRCVCPVVPG